MMIDYDQKNPSEETSGGWKGLLEKQRAEGGRSITINPRKALIARRLMLLDERFVDVIAAKLQETYNQPDVITRIRRHVSCVVNIAGDITSALACVYDQHPRRRFRDGTEDENEALIRINESTCWRAKAKEVNRKAWFAGPVLEVPVVEGDGSYRRELVTSDKYDILLPETDPLGHPTAAAYHWVAAGRKVIKVIDHERVRIFDAEDHVGFSPLYEYEHGCRDADGNPMFPGTQHRYDSPTDPADYWSNHRNERLTEATIEAGTINSAMSWVRKNQNRKWLVLMGNLDGFNAPSGQDPEGAGFWQVDDRDHMPNASVLDLETPVSGFIEHIMFLYRQQIESYGLPQSALTYDFGQGQSGGSPSVTQLSLQHDKKTKLRNDQIVFALQHERRSQYCLASVLRAASHPDAERLPALEEFDERLEIDFPELTRIEDPKTKHDELDWQLKRGHITDAHIYQMAHPELTLEECKARVLENLETQGEFNELKASRELDPASQMLDPNEASGGLRGAPQPEAAPNEN